MTGDMLPVSFLAFADFRADEDCPDDTPMTPQDWADYEAWLDTFCDHEAEPDAEEVQRELNGPHEERRAPKPLASPCGDAEEDYPL
jgi:hypothetical protein